MILTCPDVCVIKRCMWAAVNWKSTGWTTFELYLEKCDDVMYITQELTVLSLERYLKLAICYILVCYTMKYCMLFLFNVVFVFSSGVCWVKLCQRLMKHGWIQRIRSSRTAATSMDGQLARHMTSVFKNYSSWPINRMPFLFHIYHNMFVWIEYMSIPLTRYIYTILHIYIYISYMYINAILILMYSILYRFIDMSHPCVIDVLKRVRQDSLCCIGVSRPAFLWKAQPFRATGGTGDYIASKLFLVCKSVYRAGSYSPLVIMHYIA